MLTANELQKLKPKDKPYEALDGDGLYMTVRPYDRAAERRYEFQLAL